MKVAYVAKSYTSLVKPGIIIGNALTATAGFALASSGKWEISTFLFMLLGLSLVVGAACVFNNIIDRTADQKMQRTQNRALAKGMISPKNALFLGSHLAVLGTTILSLISALSATMALIGFAIYVLAYSFLKYRTVFATLIGTIAGAMPPVVGYTALGGTLDLKAAWIFALVVVWQMPHFYAIAIYRMHDYAAANIPVLPVKKGIKKTMIHMLLYVVGFVVVVFVPVFLDVVGKGYFWVMLVVSGYWLWLAIGGLSPRVNASAWARKMFLFSLVAITLVCGILTWNSLF